MQILNYFTFYWGAYPLCCLPRSRISSNLSLRLFSHFLTAIASSFSDVFTMTLAYMFSVFLGWPKDPGLERSFGGTIIQDDEVQGRVSSEGGASVVELKPPKGVLISSPLRTLKIRLR